MRKFLFAGLLSFTICGCQAQNEHTLDKAVEKSLKKADGYFKSLSTNFKGRDVLMLLFILKDHFQYPLSLEDVEQYKRSDPELGLSYLMVYGNYFEGRSIPHIGDSMAMDYLRKNVNSIDGLTVWSMFCNRYPLPDTITQLLNKNIGIGHYAMTHSALQLANMLQLGCLEDGPEIERLKEKLVKELEFEIVTELTDVTDDLRFESTAMLYYIGADTAVKSEYIQYIIDKQISDGGWKAMADGDTSNAHASALAFWALLEYNSRKK